MARVLSAWESKIQPRLAEVEAWCRDGANLHQIATRLGIAEKTLTRWRDVKPELAQVLCRGREYVDNTVVVGAYLRRITGYDADEVKREYRVEMLEDGTEVRILTKETHQTRHIPGDPRAAEFWLTHRQPDVWGALKTDDAATMPGIVIMPEPDADLLNGNGVEVGAGGGTDGRTE